MKATRAYRFGTTAAVLAAFGMLVSCGEDNAAVPSVTIVDLPVGSAPCPTGGILVSLDSDEHYVCNGERGAMGEPGTPATITDVPKDDDDAFRPKSIVACSAVFKLPLGTSANFAYSLVAFSDGSVLVSCTASTTGLVSGDATHWFAPWQNGAASQSCIVTSDASGAATSGWWEFKAAGSTYRTTYHDVGAPEDGLFYDFRISDCPTASAPKQPTGT